MDSSNSSESATGCASVRRAAEESVSRAAANPFQHPPVVSSSPLAAHGAPEAINAQTHVCVEFEIDDEKCRIVCIDGPVGNGSRRISTSANGSPASEEIARFEADGLNYVLLMPATPRAQRAARREAEVASRTDFLKLLTQRELEIVRLICTGRLNQQVADRLRISEYTVGAHLKNVYVKLGLRTRGELLFRCTQALARAAGNGNAKPD
jgi:DNA-binding CsgD family transcriptional regulator